MNCHLFVLKFRFTFTMENFELTIDLVLMALILVAIAVGLVLSYFGLTVPVLIDIGIKALRNLPRDLQALYGVVRLQLRLFKYKHYDQTAYDLFEVTTKNHHDKVALYYKDERWTYGRLRQYSLQVANFFHDQGFRAEDDICLMMSNRPEFVGLCLGLCSIGVETALINTNNKSALLLHAIVAIEVKAVIFESQYYHGKFFLIWSFV